MATLMILLSLVFVVQGDFSKSCLSKGKVLLCEKVEGNLTCQNAGVKLLNAERLVMTNPKIEKVDITSQCLPKLRTVEIVRSGMMNCSDFATFSLVIINRRVCVYTTSSTPRIVSGKPPADSKSSSSTTAVTSTTPYNVTVTMVTETTTVENATLQSTLHFFPRDSDKTKEDVALRAVVITLSILSVLLIILVFVLLKWKRCRRSRGRKLPMAEDLGSSEVVFLRSASRNPYSETKFE